MKKDLNLVRQEFRLKGLTGQYKLLEDSILELFSSKLLKLFPIPTPFLAKIVNTTVGIPVYKDWHTNLS